jgi:hypothetical protein
MERRHESAPRSKYGSSLLINREGKTSRLKLLKMKKIFSIIFLMALVLSSFAQERTVLLNSGKVFDLNVSKEYDYTGTGSDMLIPTTRDTIDFVLKVGNWSGATHFYATFKLSPISGADTTVRIVVLYKHDEGEAFSTLKATATGSAVTTTVYYTSTSLGVINSVDTAGFKYYTSNRPNPILCYKYINFRLILLGNDSVGTGVKVDRLSIQLYPF